MLVFWSPWNCDVYSSKFIMLISCLSFKLQISGPFGSLIYNPKCAWNSKFDYSIQLSLKVFMYYGYAFLSSNLICLFFISTTLVGLERILVSLKWKWLPFNLIAFECLVIVSKNIEIELACGSFGIANWHKFLSWYLIYCLFVS